MDMDLDLEKAKRWMRNALMHDRHEYDYYGEINCTKLAEMCAFNLDMYVDDNNYAIPEELFDLAIDVSEQFVG